MSWTADHDVYVDIDGNVVEATDPTVQTFLVAEGGTIPLEQAEALGLVKAKKAAKVDGDDADEKPAKVEKK